MRGTAPPHSRIQYKAAMFQCRDISFCCLAYETKEIAKQMKCLSDYWYCFTAGNYLKKHSQSLSSQWAGGLHVLPLSLATKTTGLCLSTRPIGDHNAATNGRKLFTAMLDHPIISAGCGTSWFSWAWRSLRHNSPPRRLDLGLASCRALRPVP
jgi:hypothetical protein